MKKKKTLWQWIQEVFAEWSQDNAQRLGAALAYYAGFSIAPLIVIVLDGKLADTSGSLAAALCENRLTVAGYLMPGSELLSPLRGRGLNATTDESNAVCPVSDRMESS